MRFLLFTVLGLLTFLFSSCEPTDDLIPIPADQAQSASLSFVIFGGHKLESFDPWDDIQRLFYGVGDRPVMSKSRVNDPWDTINDNFAPGLLSGVKSTGSDHVVLGGTIRARFPLEVHSYTTFVNIGPDTWAEGLATIQEVRGSVARIVYVNGYEQFVGLVPRSWEVGSLIDVEFYPFTSSDSLASFSGVRAWTLLP